METHQVRRACDDYPQLAADAELASEHDARAALDEIDRLRALVDPTLSFRYLETKMRATAVSTCVAFSTTGRSR